MTSRVPLSRDEFVAFAAKAVPAYAVNKLTI
jgi:hypothetical protein